jgi:hypothetical protein
MHLGTFHTVLSSMAQTRIRLDDSTSLGMVACILLFVFFILFVVARGMRATFGGMAAQSQLAQTGTPATGRVVAVRDIGGSIKMGGKVPSHRLQIDLEIWPQNGQQPWRASSVQMVSALNFGSVQAGATVNVRYDAANPSRVVVVI